MGWTIGLDVGGTFIDGVPLAEDGRTITGKTLSRPDDPVAGLAACLDALASRAGLSREALLGQTEKFSYGTTQAANLVVEGAGATTAFVTTRGFRDTLVIVGRGRDRIGQDLMGRRPPSLIP